MTTSRLANLTPPRLFLISGVVALVIALVLVVPVLVSGRGSVGSAALSGPVVGSLAPDFALENIVTGKQVSLASLRGKPVWLNFWASWCDGCVEEMPHIRKMAAKYGAAGLQVVGINVQEQPATVRDFVTTHGFDWTFLLDRDGRVTDLYFVNGLPYQLFIAPDGVIKAIFPGVLDEKGMDMQIKQIMDR